MALRGQRRLPDAEWGRPRLDGSHLLGDPDGVRGRPYGGECGKPCQRERAEPDRACDRPQALPAELPAARSLSEVHPGRPLCCRVPGVRDLSQVLPAVLSATAGLPGGPFQVSAPAEVSAVLSAAPRLSGGPVQVRAGLSSGVSAAP